jgi:hypothetical protein
MKPLSAYLSAIDRDEAVGLIAGLIRAGFTRGEVKAALPQLLDELLPFDLVPGPAGALLEASDGPVLRLIVEALFPFLWRRAERRASAAE